MKRTFSIKEKIKVMNRILVPILITQIAMFSMSFFDIMMTGNFSAAHLAGVAIGSSLWMPVFTGIGGILLAVTPIVAQLAGAKRTSEVSAAVIQGLYVSTALTASIILIGYLVIEPILNSMSLEREVHHTAKLYLYCLGIGVAPVFAYNVLRSFIDALGKTNITMFITLLALPVNVVLNYLLIYGKGGLPMLGGVGAGVATSVTYWIIALAAVFIIHTKVPFHIYGIFTSLPRISLSAWKETFILGIPIGMSIFVEMSIFSAVTLFMSEFGTVVIAAHQAAINFQSLLYMFPLSISMALTILVGFECGAKRWQDARIYSYLGIGQAVAISLVTGLGMFIFRDAISSLYSDETSVITWTSQFLVYALFFMLSDAVQAPIQGALRGYKDVNITLVMAVISYWIIGLPAGYLLAKHTELGPFGYWSGLIIGLAVGAATLSIRLVHKQRNLHLNKKSEQAI